MNKYIKDRIVILSGASKGIGYEMAKNLLLSGATLVALARSEARLKLLQEFADSISANLLIVQLDLVEENVIECLAGEVFKRYGKIDDLILNAAVFGEMAPVRDYDLKLWNKTINLNLTSNFRLIKNFDPLLRISKASPNVYYINDPEIEDKNAYYGAYGVSKIAAKKLLEIYKQEVINLGIGVNFLDLPPVDTSLRNVEFANEDKSLIIKPKDAAKILVDRIIETTSFNLTSLQFA